MSADSITWRELLEVVGPEAAQALGKRFGGVSKYIPRDHRRGGLLELLGPEAAQALAERFAGSTLEIPNETRRPTPKKVRIVQLLEAGWSIRRIAMRVRCTESWVKMVKRQCKENINRA
jgi:DNA-binding NarL/FixJ family response regulator